MFYNIYLCHNLWITDLLFQLVNKHMTWHSPVLLYSPITWGCKHMGIWLLEIQNQCIRLLIWLYTMSIHLMWYYRQLLDHLISIYTYIHSLRHISHYHIICTHYHLLVAPHATYYGSLERQNFQNNNIAIS